MYCIIKRQGTLWIKIKLVERIANNNLKTDTQMVRISLRIYYAKYIQGSSAVLTHGHTGKLPRASQAQAPCYLYMLQHVINIYINIML